MRLLTTLILGTFASTLAAQSCAQLTVTGTGAPGTTLALALHGDARALAFVAIGDTQGATTIHFGNLGTLNLDLATPFLPLPLGMTDANGDAAVSLPIPAGVPARDLFAQGLTATFTVVPHLGLSFCTSNVVAFHIG